MIAPDLAQARQFIKLVDPGAKQVTLQTFDDNRARKASNLARILVVKAFSVEITDLHKAGAGVYLTINETDGKGRKAENITRIRAVWQEDDDGFEGEFPLEPSLVVETSEGHFHRYWLVSDHWPADEKGRADFAAVMQRMVESYGCDKNAKDLCRVLRVPGFLHRKGEPRMVGMVGGNRKRYTRFQIIEAFPPVPESKPSYANGHSAWRPQGEEGERIQSALQAIPSDDRESWLRIGMALKSKLGDGGFDPWRAWAMRSVKFDEKDCRRVWTSIKPEGGVTIATLFGLAREHGWQEESGKAPRQRGAPREAQASAEPFKIIWGIPQGEERQRWLVDQLLPETGVGLVSGQWGTFKTFIGMDLSGAVLSGGTFAGRKVARRGGVLWLAAEGQSQVPVRLQALKTKHDFDPEQFAWVKACPQLTHPKAEGALRNLCLEAKRQYQERYCLPLALGIIDTIGAAAGWNDENSAAEAQAVMRMLAGTAQDWLLHCRHRSFRQADGHWDTRRLPQGGLQRFRSRSAGRARAVRRDQEQPSRCASFAAGQAAPSSPSRPRLCSSIMATPAVSSPGRKDPHRRSRRTAGPNRCRCSRHLSTMPLSAMGSHSGRPTTAGSNRRSTS